mgnify:CR=1 FL=1
MYGSTLYDTRSRKVVFDWFVLAFLAGSVNAGGFLACHRFVTHMTGFATLFGIDIIQGKFTDALGMLTIPLFFLLGVVVSAFLIEHPRTQKRRPHYFTTMMLVAICLILATIFGNYGTFGAFGDQVDIGSDYLLMALLCGASGLQNAAISTASGSTVRLTHITGLITDLGASLVRSYSIWDDRVAFRQEFRASLLRIGTIGSFTIGGIAGAVVFPMIGYWGFLLPAGLALYAAWLAHQHKKLSRPIDL